MVKELRASKGAVDGKAGSGEVEGLRKELARRERELEVVKKQAEGLSREYGDLSDRYAKAIGDDGRGKKGN